MAKDKKAKDKKAESGKKGNQRATLDVIDGAQASAAGGLDDLRVEPLHSGGQFRRFGRLEDQGEVLDAQALEGPDLPQHRRGIAGERVAGS